MGLARKIITGVIIIGVALGVIQLFGGNVFGFIDYCFQWIAYTISRIADMISGNDTAQKVFSTKPSDVMGIIVLPSYFL